MIKYMFLALASTLACVLIYKFYNAPDVKLGDSVEKVIREYGENFSKHHSGIDFIGEPDPSSTVYALEYRSKGYWFEFNCDDKLVRISAE